MSFFSVDNLCAGYGERRILHGVSFSAEAGQITGILGANGSGKTTLLKAICRILPHSGSCVLDGTELEGLRPKKLGQLCGYIPQRSGISIEISVLDVVLMGFNPVLGLLEYPDEEMKREAHRALALVGLEGFENTDYLQLSEGQKQLCILARTMVTDGKLLLMDEPESALDFRHRSRMLGILRQRIAGVRKGALVTLHDPALALNRCDRLILLDSGRVLDVLNPSADPMEKMEASLSVIYGPVSLVRCCDGTGREHLVMLGEEELK